MSVTLGYWEIQGFAEPIRQMMEYLHIPYTMAEYKGLEGLEKFKTQDAPTLKTAFPNLPYLIDGDIHIAQSKAIITHLIKKSGKYSQLCGANDKEEVEIIELGGHIEDCYGALTSLAYNPNFEEVKVETLNGKVLQKFQMLHDYYTKKGTKFLYSNELTFVDFWARATLNAYFLLDESKKSTFPKFVQFLNNYNEVPEMKEYFASKFINRPLNNPVSAKFY